MNNRSRYPRRLVCACVAGIVACVGLRSLAEGQPTDTAPSTAQPHSAAPSIAFGMVHLTSGQVAHLRFANVPEVGPKGNGPIRVQLLFLDSMGQPLSAPETEVLRPGDGTSLDLFGEDLPFPEDANQVGVRAVVELLDPQARGIATLEIDDSATPGRVVLFNPSIAAMTAPSPEPYFLGPSTLGVNYAARLNVVNAGQVGKPRDSLTALLEIADFSKAINGPGIVAKEVVLDYNQSASLELPKFNGEIFGRVSFTSNDSRAAATVTLEIIFTPTGQTVAVYPPSHCRGCSDGGDTGGGGYQNGSK